MSLSLLVCLSTCLSTCVSLRLVSLRGSSRRRRKRSSREIAGTMFQNLTKERVLPNHDCHGWPQPLITGWSSHCDCATVLMRHVCQQINGVLGMKIWQPILSKTVEQYCCWMSTANEICPDWVRPDVCWMTKCLKWTPPEHTWIWACLLNDFAECAFTNTQTRSKTWERLQRWMNGGLMKWEVNLKQSSLDQLESLGASWDVSSPVTVIDSLKRKQTKRKWISDYLWSQGMETWPLIGS